MSTLEETQKQPEHNYKAINNPQTIEKKNIYYFPYSKYLHAKKKQKHMI